LVEQPIRNRQVSGSSPLVGSSFSRSSFSFRPGGRLLGMAASKKSKKKAKKKTAKKAVRKATAKAKVKAKTKTAARSKKTRAKAGVAKRSAPRFTRGRSLATEPSGDFQGLSRSEQADSESVEELVEEGNAFEAGAVAGVERADNADEREVRTREFPEDDVPEEYLDEN
jgi:hypothetical protein